MAKTEANSVFDRLSKSILTDAFRVVMDLEKSRGAVFIDARTGEDYIDFFSFFASNPIGFNHPRLSEPEFEKDLLRVAKIKVSNSDVYTTDLADFISYFHEHFASQFDKLFFIEGGGLGVENALKAAQDWKAQKNLAAGHKTEGGQVLHFKKAFHGRTGYTLSLTNTVPDKTRYFPKFDWPRVTHPSLNFPTTPESLEDVKKREALSIEEIKRAFQDRPHEICAIIIEPIQGEGGDNFVRKEFLQELKRLSLENDALLVFDEVQTGLGITGKVWAYEHFGVKPDLLAFGKKVQVGGCAADLSRLNEVEHVFKVSSRINSTWGGNLTDMLRSLQFMKIIREENLLEHVRKLGEEMLGSLRELSAKEARMTNVRGLGLWMAFDLPDQATRDRYLKSCWANRLMILSCGDRSIRLRPVLNLTKQEAEQGLDRLKKSFDSL
ncbi:MAG: L-lysine 6-transaminase [Bradymonadales bacterium]|nr:MAG: L-lysine 6-transaminase [Bradymonadales bacterium]